MNKKSEKGAITLFVIIAGLFFITFLASMYMIGSINRQAQLEATKQLKETYSEGDTSAVYSEYFGEGAVPIYTYEQLLKMCSGEEIAINEKGGKTYTFSTDAIYIIMNDIVGEYDGTINAPVANFTGNGRIEGNDKLITLHNTTTGNDDLYKCSTKQILPVIARTDTNYYISLQEAANKAKDNTETTITLLTDISEHFTVPQNKDIILNAESHSLTSSTSQPTITVEGKIKIVSGNISSSTYHAIQNRGTLEISETAEISTMASNRAAILNDGKANISGGKISAENGGGITNNSTGELIISDTAEIFGGATNLSTIVNDGTVKIIGGKITATEVHAILNKTSGKLLVSGAAEITGTETSKETINNYGEATLTDGIISATNGYTINNQRDGKLIIGETAEIKVTGAYDTIYNRGMLTVNGGTATASSRRCISNYGVLTVTGGNIASTGTGSYARYS